MSLNNKEALFAKYLSGNASSEEAEKLTEWLSSDPSNQTEFDQAKSIWNNSMNLKHEEDADVEKAWSQFKNLREVGAEVKIRKINYAGLKIAAAITLFAVLGIVVKVAFTEPSASPSKQLSEAIKPSANTIIEPNPDLDYSEIDSLYREETSNTSKAITTKRKVRTLTNGLAVITLSAEDTAEIFILPDNTIVYLNADSKLEYPENFGPRDRHVVLTGEAYFDVNRDSGQFSVSCENTIIKSKVASYNVKGYSNAKEVEVLVAAGTVDFSGVGFKDFKKLVLKSEESGIYNKEKSNITKLKHQRKNQRWWEKKSFRERVKNFFDKMLGRK